MNQSLIKKSFIPVEKSWIVLIALTVGITAWALKSSVADAAEEPVRILAITSDDFQPGEIDYIAVEFDAQGNLTGLEIQDPTKPVQAPPIPITELESPNPPRLMKTYQKDANSKVYDICFLSLQEGFSPQNGGVLDLKYMTNGLFGSYKDFLITIDIQGDSVTLSYAPDPKNPNALSKFNSLFFKSSKVGIGKITPSES